MEIIQQQYDLKESAPKNCSYCDEEKEFLMIKPLAIAVNGQVQVNVNMTKSTKWICLPCLARDMDAIGHFVDIYEYDILK